MQGSTLHQNGWISIPVSEEQEVEARKIRAERDKIYKNIFAVKKTDMRWVGDLGEIVFNSWLEHEGIANFEWIRDNAAGKPDFVTAMGVRIGAKTVKRKGPPRDRYTSQITACHAKEPTDFYFFLTYQFNDRIMWLLGGIEQDRFLREATYYKAGESLHDDYPIREGHEIYNIENEKLVKPKAWLEILTGVPGKLFLNTPMA